METRQYYELSLRIKLNDIKSRIKGIFCEHSIVECGSSECPEIYTAYMCKKCRIQMRQYGKRAGTTNSNNSINSINSNNSRNN